VNRIFTLAMHRHACSKAGVISFFHRECNRKVGWGVPCIRFLTGRLDLLGLGLSDSARVIEDTRQSSKQNRKDKGIYAANFLAP
jgi:hypothetical protein